MKRKLLETILIRLTTNRMYVSLFSKERWPSVDKMQRKKSSYDNVLNVTVFFIAGLFVVRRKTFWFIRYFFRKILETTMNKKMSPKQIQRMVGWMLL